ncbi:outer membrane protein assembly factor BamA [Variovorax sp. HJSM1_2]|uniref:outer membrane protein assembly factor BamA n=1 Tax=Variovorax sp. HJSM1_2 TaxID=3366263 RepID=UPI003BE8F5CA
MNNHSKSYRLRALSATLALVFASDVAWAVDPFAVRDIRIEGLQRVEPGTVFASLPFRVGDTYNDEQGSAAIRALFALGLFKDVRLETNGDVLVVIVEERPTVADVEFAGSKEFDKDVLKKAMRDVGLTEGRPFDKALADRAEQELKRQYINKSLYGAQVVTTVTPIERNRVNVTFSITEGEPAKISEIRIVGNKAFSTSTLLGLFELDTGGWLSWYTKSDRYSRAKLNADIETLRSYYLSRGYLEFKVDSTQVAISPDKEDIAVTLNITEGERFVVSGIKVEGNYLGKEEEFKSLITIKPGQPYNADLVTGTVKAFKDYFGSFGFAFATVEAQTEIDRTNNQVALVLQANPSRRAYVRRVNIAGNSRTRDEVIRREFRQYEASWYDGDKIKLSRDRVDRLGYFKEVGIETQDVPGSPDQVDVQLNVEEKPTGSVQLGAGFSSAEKLSLSFSLKQENAFGSGNYLGFEVNTSKYNRTVVFSSIDPYFTNDGISRAFDIYYRSQRPYNDQGGDYQLVTQGMSLRFGVPFSESDTVYFGTALDRTTIKPGTNIPAAYLAYAQQFGYTSTNLPFTVGWSRDDRDSTLAPTSGRFQRFNSELGLIGDANYVKANYQYQQFIPLAKLYTFAFNGEFGYGTGLGGDPYPVFKNFYGGGLGSVRGFDQGTLGPRDVTGSSIGGSKKFNINAEMLVPFPGAGNDRTLRLYGFADVGNVYGENDKFDLSVARASVGIGLSWISPVGPLRLAYAEPVRKFPGDRIQKLQFQIGTSF